MRARLVSSALAAAVACTGCTGCTGARALREHAERRATIVPEHVAAPLEPATGYVLVNPLVCASGGSSSGGALAAVLVVGCAGVLGAVDLLALPFMAVQRSGQQRDLEQIGAACPLEDPASRLARDLAGVMVRDFQFRAPASDSQRPLSGAVIVEVRTARFSRSSRIEWEGLVVFRGPDGKVLWQDTCEAEAPERHVGWFEQECEAARAEVASIASLCVGSVASRLRQEWQSQESQPVAEASGTSVHR